MPHQPLWWFIICLDVTLIGVTKSGFGSGVGLMIVPIMAIALDHVPGPGSVAALGLLLPLLIVGDFIAVSQYFRLFFPRRNPVLTEAGDRVSSPDQDRLRESLAGISPPGAGSPDFKLATAATVLESPAPIRMDPHAAAAAARTVLWRLMPGTAVGVVLGATLLWVLHQRADLVAALIRIEIGLESILLVSLHWWRLWRGIQKHLMPEPWRSHLTGGFSAISSTLAHAAGPIIAMYLLPLRLDRQLYVGTCAVYFFLLNTAKLPAYQASGQFAHAQLKFTLYLLPLVFTGALLGRWIIKRMSDRLFTQIVYGITFLLGWYILADGLSQLLGRIRT